MSIPAEQLEGLSTQDLLQVLQSGGGVTSEFLGVEGAAGDFKARRPKRPRTDPTGEQFGFVDVAPTFTSEHVGAFYALSPEERLRLQLDMQKAGVLKDFVAGDADPNTLSAYEGVLGFANRNGFRKVKDAVDALARSVDKSKSLGVGGVGAQSLPAPETVGMAVDDATVRLMGRKLDPEERQSIVDAYTNVYTSRVTGGAVQPPSVDAFVEERIGETDEARGFDFATRVQDFYSQLNSPVSVPRPERPAI